MRLGEILVEANKARLLGYDIDSIGDILFRYKDDANYYVTFHKVNKVGINPSPRYLSDNTPMGIYAFRLKDHSKVFERKDQWIDVFDQGGFITKDGNLYGSILRYNGIGKLVSDQTYTEEDGKGDYDILNKKYGEYIDKALKGYKWENIFYFVDSIARNIADKRFSKLSKEKQDIPYSFVSRAGVSMTTGGGRQRLISHQVIWNDIMRKDLNWGVIVDKSGNISQWEPSQALFTSIKSFDIIGTYLLPKHKQHGKKDFQARMNQSNELNKLEGSLGYYIEYIKDKTAEEIAKETLRDLPNLSSENYSKIFNQLVDMNREMIEEKKQKAVKDLQLYYKLGGRKRFKI